MVEIKDGWTWAETDAQYESARLAHEIKQLNEKLTAALERQSVIRDACTHAHVEDTTCSVCGSRIE